MYACMFVFMYVFFFIPMYIAGYPACTIEPEVALCTSRMLLGHFAGIVNPMKWPCVWFKFRLDFSVSFCESFCFCHSLWTCMRLTCELHNGSAFLFLSSFEDELLLILHMIRVRIDNITSRQSQKNLADKYMYPYMDVHTMYEWMCICTCAFMCVCVHKCACMLICDCALV